jgi:hypothetical protein
MGVAVGVPETGVDVVSGGGAATVDSTGTT